MHSQLRGTYCKISITYIRMYVRSSFSLIIFIDGLLNGILIEDHSLYIVHKYILTLHKKSNTPFFYMLCLLCKKAYRELNLERALDEDTGPGEVFSFLSAPLGQTAVSGNSTLHQ